jgi:ubiquitin fusion degradation protein 1
METTNTNHNNNAAKQSTKWAVLMPPSALYKLGRLEVSYPMMFQVSVPSGGSSAKGKQTHCGVLEFSSEEGVAYLPYWMMQNLFVEDGSFIHIRNVTLPKGTFCKLQPHRTAFIDLANPRVVLEKALRGYSCLSRGDTIKINHAGENFYLDVVDVKPGDAISVIETDVNVDFAAPKDYKEPPKVFRNNSKAKDSALNDGASAATAIVFNSDESSSSSSTSSESKLTTPSKKASTTSSSSSSNSSSSYFAKLGAGHQLTAKRKTTARSPASQSLFSGYTKKKKTSAEAEAADEEDEFTYIYSKEGKLLRRVKKQKRSFFSGKGNSLK